MGWHRFKSQAAKMLAWQLADAAFPTATLSV